jgi:putative N6-adenine-specific DNA methylase
VSSTELVFASCTPGLEGPLAVEAAALGEVTLVTGGVEIAGMAGLHRRANLCLRTASRVLVRVGEFSAPGPDELERGLSRLSLSPFAASGVGGQIEVVTHRSRLRPRRIEEIARQVWRLQEENDDAAALSIRLRIEADRCTVSVDSTGELLHRRGYREEISRGPLRETLAAGMLLLAGYRGDEPLWDPMCGSGTLPIEAALIALHRAPGRDRHFAFEQWPSHDAAAWQAELAGARSEELAKLPSPILASDLHSGALRKAERNATRAGVRDLIGFTRHDATKPRADLLPTGLLVANLPYGIRVGDQQKIAALYRSFGVALRELKGWRAALLVADRTAEKQLAWTPEQTRDLDNGGIRCRLLSGSC